MSAADVYGFRLSPELELTIEAEVMAVVAQVDDLGIDDLVRLTRGVRDVIRLQIVRDHMAVDPDVPPAVLVEVEGVLAAARRELADL